MTSNTLSIPLPSANDFVSSTFADIAAGEPIARPVTAGDHHNQLSTSRLASGVPLSTYFGAPSPTPSIRGLSQVVRSGPNAIPTKPPATPGPAGIGLLPAVEEHPLDNYTPRTAYDMKR